MSESDGVILFEITVNGSFGANLHDHWAWKTLFIVDYNFNHFPITRALETAIALISFTFHMLYIFRCSILTERAPASQITISI